MEGRRRQGQDRACPRAQPCLSLYLQFSQFVDNIVDPGLSVRNLGEGEGASVSSPGKMRTKATYGGSCGTSLAKVTSSATPGNRAVNNYKEQGDRLSEMF